MDDMILASAGGAEERVINYPYDIDVGRDNTFELSIPIDDWKMDMGFGKRIYIPGTEYGGIIKSISSDTSKDTIFVKGYTWRGHLARKYVTGTFTGDANAVLRSMLGSLTGVFQASDKTAGINVSIRLDKYTSILDAISGQLTSAGYRLDVKYVQTRAGGYVELAAVPAGKYGDEVSQDIFIDFSIEDDRMTVNHLIVVYGGMHADVYADSNGNISQSQTLIGIDEITEVYEATSATDLVQQGKDKLADKMTHKTMTASFRDANDIDLNVGDFISGIDYVTGIALTKPITGKILTYEDDVLSIEYSIEEGGTE